MAFTVAIIGRPNVGKSTLFNRLVGKKLALVHDTPGLTRDWREADGHLLGLDFNVIDTAGLEESFDASIQGRMRRQTEQALARADIALLVIDARVGVTPMDRHFADWIRRQKMPSALIANKCENKASISGMYEAYELGLGEPIAISAEHGHGMDDLFTMLRPYVDKADKEASLLGEGEEQENLEKYFELYEEGANTGFGDQDDTEEDKNNPVKIAIVGRPNVGKS
ncbi:MAG: 50S ribosome-binding GTPase, partial [Alphaproteobacteria bacterium]|nr:50S ribosome-binding GTPase [Alphaproteobacteria bacterium]